MNDNNATIFEDWSIVSFFSLPEIAKKYRLEIVPFKNSNGKIAFKVCGDIESALGEIYSNRKIPINDYLKAMKSTRHTIFILRSLNVENRGQK